MKSVKQPGRRGGGGGSIGGNAIGDRSNGGTRNNRGGSGGKAVSNGNVSTLPSGSGSSGTLADGGDTGDGGKETMHQRNVRILAERTDIASFGSQQQDIRSCIAAGRSAAFESKLVQLTACLHNLSVDGRCWSMSA